MDLGCSSRPHRDKGKARALDPTHDCLHSGSSSAGASTSQRANTARLVAHSVPADADYQAKGKHNGEAEQQAFEPSLASFPSSPYLPYFDVPVAARRSRRIQAAKDGSDELHCRSSSDTPSHKRSLRDTANSSPDQPAIPLGPVAGPSCPIRRHHRDLPPLTRQASPDPSQAATPASALRSRFNLANKKRRSEIPDGNDTSLLQPTTSRHLLSNPPTPQLRPSARAHSPALEPHSSAAIRLRRPSLLVNSGTTTDVRSSNAVAALCESPEPIDDLSSSHPSRRDQLELRSAHFAESRAQRSLGTLRRRRAFYSRDPSSANPDTPTHQFDALAARHDSLLGSSSMPRHEGQAQLSALPPNSRQNDLAASQRAFAHHRPLPLVEPNDHAHRNPPQLPHVRAASPLAISFASDADHEAPAPSPLRHLTTITSRRRASTQLAPGRQDDDHHVSNTPTSNAIFNRAQSQVSAHPDTSSDQLSLLASAHRYASQPSSLRVPSISERYTPYQSHDDRPRAHVRFGATDHEALGRESHDDRGLFTLHRRNVNPHHSRPDAATSSMHDGLQPSRNASQRRETSDSLRRLREPASSEREPLPWRSTHFGLRRPSQASERQTGAPSRYESLFQSTGSDSRPTAPLPASRGAPPAWTRHARNADESALEYLGRLMSHDSMLDEWMAGDVHAASLRMAIESETWNTHSRPLQLGLSAASSSMVFGHHGSHLALDARNFIADEDWAELNSYEALMQLSDRLGAAEVCVPASLVDALPTCEYAKWDGGSCAPRDDAVSAKGKGKQKAAPPPAGRDTMCPICRDDYADADVLMSINTCHHAFHAHCIRTWFKTAKTCPLCRADAFDGVSLPALPFGSSTASSTTVEPNALYPPFSFDF
ncbi:FOG: Predicted E3 ubiquitin ligase [Moesziomyces antarcticus T-34]|uniref:FOG: Predicted E3 ubiquitin ligase n=1 Tax=Pseudozyma antarctica (strain T-34) TaxID=1151754 RepID=M9ME03_PSEA3|nr:FOG: Predicted E3 ubiquitin ligase [Moesziomyces antarcticus T-34]